MSSATELSVRELPKLYTELAEWWPVLSAPSDYEEEAGFFHKLIVEAAPRTPRSMLELGSGGGNNASFLKEHFEMTLTDLSPRMLEQSRRLNPECEHIAGDMRSIRLARRFDAVFVHDAVDYMLRPEDLRAAMQTAWEHCRPGGVAVFVPDHTRENFRPLTEHGGHDVGDRSLRYLQWDWDPDPGDTSCMSLMIYAMREAGRPLRCVQDLHEFGLFGERDWLGGLAAVGFAAQKVPLVHSEVEPGSCDIFLGLKPD